MNPNVSIVSVTYRSLADTKAFVDSVYSATTEPYEFIMAANGVQEDDLIRYLHEQELSGKMKVVWLPQNVGVRAFNTVMRLAQTDFIFRCDSDILIGQPYWTEKMRTQWEVSQKEIGDVVAVGTSNTRGHQIQRTEKTIEVDLIMSNCMMIHRQEAMKLKQRLQKELPRMEAYLIESRLINGRYPGEIEDLEATIEYAKYHAPYWDLNFGGKDQSLGYGSDDFLWSILARWAGLKLVASSTRVLHKDASARPGYEDTRHKLVSRGFQYMRTCLSLVMDCWEPEFWHELPNNLPVLKNFRSGTLV